MGYQVMFVESGTLPAGVDWAFARTIGETYLFVSWDAIHSPTGRCDALCRAWEAWEKVAQREALARSA